MSIDRRKLLKMGGGLAAILASGIAPGIMGVARAEPTTYSIKGSTWYTYPSGGQYPLIVHKVSTVNPVWVAALSSAQQMKQDFYTEVAKRNSNAGLTESDYGYQFCDIDVTQSTQIKTSLSDMENTVYGQAYAAPPGTDNNPVMVFDGKVLAAGTSGWGGLVQTPKLDGPQWTLIIGGVYVVLGAIFHSEVIAAFGLVIIAGGLIWNLNKDPNQNPPDPKKAISTTIDTPALGPAGPNYVAATVNTTGNLSANAYDTILDQGTNPLNDPAWSSQAWFKPGTTNLTKGGGLSSYYS